MARSIRMRRSRKKLKNKVELNLTAMMDILTIILVFLLKSYTTSVNAFTTVSGIELPLSSSQDYPPESLQVIVTPEAITFEDQRILSFVQKGDLTTGSASYSFNTTDLDSTKLRIIPLFDALIEAKKKSELLKKQSKARTEGGEPLPFNGNLAIQADKRVRYDTIRRIMYTSAVAGYQSFRFLAMKKQ